MSRKQSAVQPEISEFDAGLFGPGSVLWNVLGERTVVLGGMRALLMHAVHPLVAAATTQTGAYEADPWGRHRRTLDLTYALVFGGHADAMAAVRRINAVHRDVRGVDRLTGLAYQATDPDLLIWVHATLASSFLLYERITVGALDAAGREQFCAEWARVARLLGVPAARVPDTTERIEASIEGVIAGGVLRPTKGSALLAGILRAPVRNPYGAKLRTAAFLALHTLPPALRVLYQVDHRGTDQRLVDAACFVTRAVRRRLPERARLIPAALAAQTRTRRPR